MVSRLNPYINFDNKTKEAMEFYKSALGGNLVLSTYKESGAPDEGDKIMHAMLETDNGMVIMASDVPSHMKYSPGENISISLSGNNEAELKGYWDKLSEGANIGMPLATAPWGDMFGMLTDKFGIHWMVNISGKK